MPRILVSDNVPEFCDSQLCDWLRRIGCKPLKTPAWHGMTSNGLAERMVQTVKRGIKAFSCRRNNFDAYLQKLLMSYQAIPHRDKSLNPSVMMGRQIRSPLSMNFETNCPLVYVAKPGSRPEEVEFIVQEGHNTAIIV